MRHDFEKVEDRQQSVNFPGLCSIWVCKLCGMRIEADDGTDTLALKIQGWNKCPMTKLPPEEIQKLLGATGMRPSRGHKLREQLERYKKVVFVSDGGQGMLTEQEQQDIRKDGPVVRRLNEETKKIIRETVELFHRDPPEVTASWIISLLENQWPGFWEDK